MTLVLPSTPLTAQTAEGHWPSPVSAWYGVSVLTFAALVAILDRQVLSLLVDPIRATLGLTDLQIGVLQGPAFMISYTVVGLLFGWMIDRTHRLRLVTAGIVTWTFGTIACGLAGSYQEMIIARALVGFGEAVLSPATVSLLADYFSPTRRAMAMSVQGTAAMCGTGLSLMAAGAVMVTSGSLPPIVIEGLPTIEGWRLVFIACAVPGVMAAIMSATAREPNRHAAQDSGSELNLLAFIKIARSWLLCYFAAVCLIATITYAFINWVPSLMIRRYSWAAEDVGFTIGLLFLILGPIGVLTGGYLTQMRQRRGEVDAAPRSLRIGVLMVAIAIVSLVLPWPSWAVVLPIAVAIFSISLLPSVAIIAVQQATPNHMRGQVAAIYFVTTNLIGSSIGPVATGVLTQYLFKDPSDINLSLAAIAIVVTPLILIALSLSMAPYRALVTRISPLQAPAAIG